MAQHRSNGRANGKRKVTRPRNGHSDHRIELTHDETKVLMDACEMFRHSLPVYLMSSKPDLQLINKVMRKLR